MQNPIPVFGKAWWPGGRTRQRARRSGSPSTNETASIPAPTARAAASFDPGRNPGVGVDHSAACRLRTRRPCRRYSAECTRASSSLVASRTRPSWSCREIAGALEMTQDRLQPLGPLRVAGRDPVVEHPAIGEKTRRSSFLPAFSAADRGNSMKSNHSRAGRAHGQHGGPESRPRGFHVKRTEPHGRAVSAGFPRFARQAADH